MLRSCIQDINEQILNRSKKQKVKFHNAEMSYGSFNSKIRLIEIIFGTNF